MIRAILLGVIFVTVGFAEEIVETIKRPSMYVIGIECRTINLPDRAPIDISKLKDRFFAEGIQSQIPNKVSNDVIVLYCDYEGDITQPYTCVFGCETSTLENVPKGMVGKKLPESNYKVFKAVGDFPKSVVDTWQKIWKAPLPRTYTGDFEVYGKKFTLQKDSEVDVFIAVED